MRPWKRSNRLLFFTGAGVEITWLYAWASFLLVNCFQRRFPLPQTIAAFLSAAVLTLYPRGRGWRMIQIIGVHLVGLICACLWIVHSVAYPAEPFWNRAWLTALFTEPRGHLEWFLLVFVLGFAAAFWITGIRFARQPRSYHCACLRFDKGLAALFFLFLIKLMLQTQMQVQFQDTTTVLLVFPFFIFGLTEIGLSRNAGNGSPKDYLEGYRTVGVLAGFVFGVLILGAGVFLLFLPYLKSASLVGYELIKSAARPLAPVLVALLRFLFGYAKTRPAEPRLSSSPTGSDIPPVGETGGWMLWVEKVLLWGGTGLLIAIGIAALCLGIWYGIRWLFSRQAVAEKDRLGWGIMAFWNRVKAWLLRLYGRMMQRKEAPGGFWYYAAVLRWGRLSGVRHKPNETPREYGLRLSRVFPKVRREITLIVDLFQCEVYGAETLVEPHLSAMRKALKRMRVPWMWPYRLKFLFFPDRI